MTKLLWIFECIIALPFLIAGFVWRSITMGFTTGMGFADWIYEFECHGKKKAE